MVVSTISSLHYYHNVFGPNEPHFMPHWANNSIVKGHFVCSDCLWFQSITLKYPVVHLFPLFSGLMSVFAHWVLHVFLETSLKLRKKNINK